MSTLDVNLLDPSFDVPMSDLKGIPEAKKNNFYTIDRDSLGTKFSLSLSVMLDSHPVVPKKVIIVRHSSAAANSNPFLCLLIGSSHIKLQYANKAAVFFITLWPDKWQKLTFIKNGNLIHLFVNCVKIGTNFLSTNRYRESQKNSLFRQSRVSVLLSL